MGALKHIQFITDRNGCHVCISHNGKDGYPEITRGGKKMRLSHFIYEVYYDKIPEGMILLHTCDNPSCINPQHLQLGTHKDNVVDKIKKNRHAKGSKNGRAKLTERQVWNILKQENKSPADLAEIYGVKLNTIQCIRRGRIWNHVFSRFIKKYGKCHRNCYRLPETLCARSSGDRAMDYESVALPLFSLENQQQNE
jgi:hypothetical protein